MIVESEGISLFQHNPFMWEVDVRAAEFVRADGYTASSRFFNSTLDAWMDKYSLAERGKFVDALFEEVDVRAAEFVRADGYTASSRFFNSTLDAWMDKYSLAERGKFVDALFDVIGVTGATHFSDIMADIKTSAPLMLEAIEGLDPELQQFVKDVIRSFVRIATVDRVGDAASGMIGSIKGVRP